MPPTPRHAAVTIASRRFLGLARATAASFLRHNPGLPFFIVLADGDAGRADLCRDPVAVIGPADLDLPDPQGFRFRYSEIEFSYALTPFAIDHLLRRGYDGVVFLKQETLVLDDLGPVLAKLADHSVLLTPHFLTPPKRPQAQEALAAEINVLRAGVFNGGFLAFSRCDEAGGFLKWWKARTALHCRREVERGIHFEQRWLDLAPGVMPRYGILRDPGVNVGHWNLPERDIRVAGGKVTACGRPCRVFRFSGYDPEFPDRVTRHNAGFTVASTGEAAAVFEYYRRKLLAAGHAQFRTCDYAFDRYDNGDPVTEADRRAYRELGDDAHRFGDPFRTAGPGSFHASRRAAQPETAR